MSTTAMAVDREAAWNLLCAWTQSDALRKHALGVEAAMRAYAKKLGGDEELWAVTGLLHDLDYEQHPTKEEHPFKGVEALREAGYPEEVLKRSWGTRLTQACQGSRSWPRRFCGGRTLRLRCRRCIGSPF